MGSLDGRSILVTGGTGSFGTAFVRKILNEHAVKRLVIYSRDELKQFEMQQEINGPNVRYFIGDVRDQNRLERALDQIDVVVHAAAMKQVVASEYNPMECIMTNVMGAENVINASINAGVKKVIALSTDKAVNPLNLYGATKLCSDKLFVAANNFSHGKGCTFSIVRYGNVIGSRGSVIPLFKKQAETGTLTITHKDMTRFWLTLKQGCEFVIQCISEMKGGEIFVPKIPSMRISDLAAAMCPGCKIEIIGIRPGEKIHEILIPEDEARNTWDYGDSYVVQPAFHMWQGEVPTEYGGISGTPVPEGFEYNSSANENWVNGDTLTQLISTPVD